MKAIIKVVTAEKQFSKDQEQILRRISNVLRAHGLSVVIITKEKTVQQLDLHKGKLYKIDFKTA